MKLYEFTISDHTNLNMNQIQKMAEDAAYEEAFFMSQSSQGTDQWNIQKVELDGLPVSEDETIVYHFTVYGTMELVKYEN
jgi:hypothetical protein